MNRRGFLRSLIGGVAATAAVRAWPFRVYSFPSAPIAQQNIFYEDGVNFVFYMNADQLAAWESLRGLAYHHTTEGQGTWLGLNRSKYPKWPSILNVELPA